MTPQQRLAVVRHLASGKPVDLIAQIMRIKPEQVTAQLTWAADQAAARLDEQARHSLPPSRIPRTAVLVADPPKPDPLRVLLDRAKGHASPRVRKAAQRLTSDADRLGALITAEDRRAAEKAQKRSQPRATPRVTDKVVAFQQLDAQLRAQAPAADVRAWAHTQGIPCPDKGRISLELRQQYLNHTRQQEDQPA